MRHHRSDEVHALLAAQELVVSWHVNGQTVVVAEPLRQLRASVWLAALKTEVRSGGLSLGGFRDVENDDFHVEKEEIVVEVLVGVEALGREESSKGIWD